MSGFRKRDGGTIVSFHTRDQLSCSFGNDGLPCSSSRQFISKTEQSEQGWELQKEGVGGIRPHLTPFKGYHVGMSQEEGWGPVLTNTQQRWYAWVNHRKGKMDSIWTRLWPYAVSSDNSWQWHTIKYHELWIPGHWVMAGRWKHTVCIPGNLYGNDSVVNCQ